MTKSITKLAAYLSSPARNVRMEAEGTRDTLQKFFEDYRHLTSEQLDFDTDGVVPLQDSADKWGLELRLYISDVTGFPDEYAQYLTSNTRFEERYRPYAARLNSNSLIMQLIERGLRIGDS